jgi:hypothetical protein
MVALGTDIIRELQPECIYLSMALRPLLDLRCYFSFLIFTQSVGLLGRGISPSQGRHIHTGQHKENERTHKHPCLQ